MNKNDKNLNILYDYITNNFFSNDSFIDVTFGQFVVNYCKIENHNIKLKISHINSDTDSDSEILEILNYAVFSIRVNYDKYNNTNGVYIWYDLFDNENTCVSGYDCIVNTLYDVDSVIYLILNFLTDIPYINIKQVHFINEQ